MKALDALSVFTRSPAPKTPDLAEAATTFEAYLMGEIMRKGARPIAGEGMLDGGSAGRMYRELLYQELVQTAAGSGFGLANWIEQQTASADTPESDATPSGSDDHRSES